MKGQGDNGKDWRAKISARLRGSTIHLLSDAQERDARVKPTASIKCGRKNEIQKRWKFLLRNITGADSQGVSFCCRAPGHPVVYLGFVLS